MEAPIPSKEKKEWRQLIRGELDVQLSNFVLQMNVTQARKDVKANLLDLEEAIDDIHSLCEKYSLAVQQDMRKIFPELQKINNQ
jgi:hypothetical protein